MNEFTTMDPEEIITKEEAQKRGYDTYEEDSRLLFFIPACIEDPQTVDYVKEQWSIIGNENEKPMHRRKCYLRMTYGMSDMDFQGWVISSRDLRYECGMILNNGKDKPIIMYGELDCMNLGIDINKKWPATVEEVEALRLKHLIKPSKARRTDEEWKKAESILGEDDDDNCGDFFTYWKDLSSGYQWLHQIAENAGLAYTVAQVYLAYLAHKGEEWQTLKSYAELLEEKQSQYKEYWQAKAELAAKKLQNQEKAYLEKGFDRISWKKQLLTEARQALVGLEPETPFHTLVYDCNAVYGQILLSLDTEENYKENLESYKPDEEEVDELRFSAGDFDYFETAHISLSDYDELDDIFGDMNIAAKEFMIMACEGLLDLTETEEFKAIPKTADFAIMCSDHDESFEESQLRLEKVRFSCPQNEGNPDAAAKAVETIVPADKSKKHAEKENWIKLILEEFQPTLHNLQGVAEFHTLIMDCNDFAGEIYLSLQTKERFQENIELYELNREEAEDYRFNPGYSDYQEIADVVLTDYKNFQNSFTNPETAYEKFMIIACEGLIALTETPEFKALTKTADFAVSCSNEHEERSTSKRRLKMLQQKLSQENN